MFYFELIIQRWVSLQIRAGILILYILVFGPAVVLQLYPTQAIGANFTGNHHYKQNNKRILFTAAYVFDGQDIRENAGVLIENDKIIQVGQVNELIKKAGKIFELGNATLLPGFIELHAHVLFQKIPPDVVLRHGITTLRDVGGPLKPPSGGVGELRILTAGPIITVQKGYPISVFGKGYIAEPVNSQDEARKIVRKLILGGAALIKVAIEPGGEAGAPWNGGHHQHTTEPWSVPSVELIKAIVEEAHKHNRIVTAHIGEDSGAKIANAAGVDEWAHIPCAEIHDETAQQAAALNVRVVTTLDTMSHCHGLFLNAKKLANLGVRFLYGAEIAHSDIPWGIDSQELSMMTNFVGMSPLQAVKAATADAGEELGLAPLGSLTPGAPADLIATRGNAMKNMKVLEYPGLVVSGGKVVVNEFGPPIQHKRLH